MQNMASPDISTLLSSISSTGSSFALNSRGAREELIALAYKLAAVLETPSEVIQRVGWAEVSILIRIRLIIADSKNC